MSFSIIHYYGGQEGRCGYCKGTNCSISHGMHAYTLTPRDYQGLIDRGWRRSGLYCYKQQMKKTCCPSYTIKCDTTEFKLSKSHKKILRRMNRFLRDGKKEKSETTGTNSSSSKLGSDHCAEEDSGNFDNVAAVGECEGLGINDEPRAPNVPLPSVNIEAIKPGTATATTTTSADEDSNTTLANEQPTADTVDGIDLSKKSLEAASSNKSSDSCTSRPPCKKAKQLRIERRNAKLQAKGIEVSEAKESLDGKKPMNSQEKTLEQYLADVGPNDKHKLKIVLISSKTLTVTNELYNLYRKYQLTIHNDKPDRVTPTSLERFLFKTPLKLQLVLVKSKEFENTLKESYKLYESYQTKIHNDPPQEIGDYLEFLQNSPLKHIKPDDGPDCGYGSFHQQYWLDDKLIAVGVIDILPYCLSSVYFFYDPDYSFLSLGTYASLREIDFVQQLSRQVSALKYYYMGFYIHSCPKMRYKGRLSSSYLLCPEAYTWHLLTDETRNRLDACKYQRLNENPEAKDADDFESSDLNDVLVLVDQRTYTTYGSYIQSKFKVSIIHNALDAIRSRIYGEITGEDDDRHVILEYGKLVGKTCAHRMLFLKN